MICCVLDREPGAGPGIAGALPGTHSQATLVRERVVSVNVLHSVRPRSHPRLLGGGRFEFCLLKDEYLKLGQSFVSCW